MASNGCPQEIVDLIVDFFIGPAEPDPQLLAPISLVSRSWSYAVSRRLWDAITVENDLDGIHRFRDTYSNPRHRDHLRVVTYTNCVPLDTPVLTDAFGNPFFSNVSMSQAYFGVFGLFLATVNRLFDHDERKNLALRIEPGRQPWFHYGSYYQWNTPPHLFLMPFDARFMLPAVRAVTRLFIGGDGYDEPTVHPSMVNVILRSFPNVEELEWMMASPALSEKVERGVHWNGLLKTMTVLQNMENLTALTLNGLGYTPDNHNFQPSSAYTSGDHDRVNQNLHHLSKRLKTLELKDWMVSPDLFLPSQGSGSDGEDRWRFLESLRVSGLGFAPDGSWYFTGARAARLVPGRLAPVGADPSGRLPDHRWRTDAEPRTLNPLMEAMSKALLRMDRLRDVKFQLYNGSLRHGLFFDYTSVAEGGKAVALEFGGEWRITDEILNCWKELGNVAIRYPCA